ARLIDFRDHVVIAGLGADADFFEFLLMDLGFGVFARLLVAELAVVQNLADGRSFGGRHLYQVEVRLAGHFEGLRGRNHSKLFAVDSNETDGTDANLFVDALAPIMRLRRMTVGRNTSISLLPRETSSHDSTRNSQERKGAAVKSDPSRRS